MAIISVPVPKSERPTATSANNKPSRRRKTSHLKLVPETKALRNEIRQRTIQIAGTLDKSRPPTKDEMERACRSVLAEMDLPEGYVGWTMVALSSAFWRDQIAAVPASRRLFLLPHCLKHAEGCPADYDEFGLDCKRCGACSIADFRTQAEQMGYKVLVAEGSPIILKIIVSGYVDAIMGVACLNVLEKAIDKILLAGIPCMAVPLLSSDCRNTSVDEDWVHEMIHVQHAAPVEPTRTYVHLMRATSAMFEPEQLDQLVPRQRGAARQAAADNPRDYAPAPIGATEAIAYDFLARGGKHSRPFITLAVHDALTGGLGTLSNGAEHLAQLPAAIKRAAMSIEIFHKASLVHDDIEDDDLYRYGHQTLHHKHGVPTAINVGDYLIGLGYRLVSREANDLGADVAADILATLASAHMRLCEGQGAELVWRDSPDKRLRPIDALKIYSLKTAPAFEAALLMGIQLAGPAEQYTDPMRKLTRHLGVAFQILNDLRDWLEDGHNKLASGTDVQGGRPTVLWALAMEALPEEARRELLSLVNGDSRQPGQVNLNRVRQLYHQADVFDQAARLVDKYQDRAEEIVDQIQPEQLRHLLYYLIDTILERPRESTPEIVIPTLPEFEMMNAE